MKSTFETKGLIVGAAITGVYHQFKKMPCQDSVSYYSDDTVCCAALADGAGSIRNSENISQCVTKTLVDDFQANYSEWFAMNDSELMNHIVTICSNSLNDRCPDLKLDCTLLFFGEAEDNSLLIHVGDGCAVACGDRYDILSRPENGDEPNITFFLSNETLSSHFRVIRDIDYEYSTIVFSSDGAANLLYDNQNEKVANAVPIMAEWMEDGDEIAIKEQLKDTIESLFKDYSNDDISVIIIRRPEYSIQEEPNTDIEWADEESAELCENSSKSNTSDFDEEQDFDYYQDNDDTLDGRGSDYSQYEYNYFRSSFQDYDDETDLNDSSSEESVNSFWEWHDEFNRMLDEAEEIAWYDELEGQNDYDDYDD